VTAVTITNARANLGALIRQVNEDHVAIEIVAHGGNAVLMSAEDYGSLKETLAERIGISREGGSIMTTYTAAIATESSVVSGDYCDVAVIINDDSQPEPQLGSELALDPVELNVRTDDPDKLVKVEIAAETALLMRRWRVTGKWEVAGNALYAPVTKTGETPS
jgi:prevent-host-death family protein